MAERQIACDTCGGKKKSAYVACDTCGRDKKKSFLGAEQSISCDVCGKRKNVGGEHLCAGEQMVACDTCNKRKSIGTLFGGRHRTCASCATWTNLNPDKTPIIQEEAGDFVEAIVKHSVERSETIENARDRLFGTEDSLGMLRSIEEDFGGRYDAMARGLIVRANQFEADLHPFSSTRTIVVGTRLVDGTKLATAILQLCEKTNFGVGRAAVDGALNYEQSRAYIAEFCEQALRTLAKCFGTYKARALFKEIVRPQGGQYSGSGTPGVFHSIKDEIDLNIEAEQSIDINIKVPGWKGSRFSYSTDQMGDVVVAELAKQISLSGRDLSSVEDAAALGKELASKVTQFNEGTKSRQYPNGIINTLVDQWTMFLQDMLQFYGASTKKLRKSTAKKGLEGKRSFVAKYAKKQANYAQFWDNLWNMFQYYNNGVMRASSTPDREQPTRMRKIQTDMAKMADRAARLVSLYFDGDTEQARALVNGFLGLAIVALIEQVGTEVPADVKLKLKGATNLSGDEPTFASAPPTPSAGKQPPAPPVRGRWDDD